MRFYNIPMNLIYPFDSKRIAEAFEFNGEVDLPDSIGYHWYAGHRISQKFNNILTEKNFGKYNTLFSKITSMIL